MELKTPPVSMKAMTSLMRSILGSILGKSHDGMRDLYAAFGYPRELDAEDFHLLYLRNDIASRIIRIFPSSTWSESPLIRDEAGSSAKPETNDYSPFVEAVEDLFDEHRIIHRLERADRLASIGRYGVLLMGFDDKLKLEQPMVDGQKAPLLYLTGYGEMNVTVQQYEMNENSRRFGKPVLYNIRTGSTTQDAGSRSKSLLTHYSRIIHLSEHLDQDDTLGTPRLMPVYNRLKDLEKVVGASAETFWYNSRPGLGLFADKEASFDEEILVAMQKQADDFEHQLRRTLALQGVTAQQFTAAIADPAPNVSTLLDLISGAVGVPKRILIGSERGELGGDNDENNWAERKKERRKNFAVPVMLQPLVRKLIDTGNLPAPEGAWWCEWTESAPTPVKAAELGERRSNILRNYLTPGAELIVPPGEFRKEFLGLPPETEYEDPLIKETDFDEEALGLEEEPDPLDKAIAADMLAHGDPDQPRDDDGKWT